MGKRVFEKVKKVEKSHHESHLNIFWQKKNTKNGNFHWEYKGFFVKKKRGPKK